MNESLAEVELTQRRLLSVYWLFIWRGMLGGAVFGAIIGFVIGLVIGFMHGDLGSASLLIAAAGFIVGIVWSVLVLRMALTKRCKDFRIAIVGL